MQSWLYLFGAIGLEVAGTTAMKLSQGFTRWLPSVLIFLCYGLSFVGLTLALKRIEVSAAYAIWSGVGTVMIAGIGMVYFKEEVSLFKLLNIALIVIGVIGLNLSGVKQ